MTYANPVELRSDSAIKFQALELLAEKGLGKSSNSSVYQQEADRQLKVIAHSNRTFGLSMLQMIGEINFKVSQGNANESKSSINLAIMRMEVAAALATTKYKSCFLLG